jgi:hypothetical protein
MGSFKGLYTFANVANMYDVDQDHLIKGIGERFVNNIDVKRFGETWVITEGALLKEFGFVPLFNDSNFNMELF